MLTAVKSVAGFIHRDSTQFQTGCQDKRGSLFMTMFDGRFSSFCWPDMFQVRLSLKISPDMEIPVGIYSKTTRDLAGADFFCGQMWGTCQQTVGIWFLGSRPPISRQCPPHLYIDIGGCFFSYAIAKSSRCEFSTVEKTVEIGSGTLASILNTYGAKVSFLFEWIRFQHMSVEFGLWITVFDPGHSQWNQKNGQSYVRSDLLCDAWTELGPRGKNEVLFEGQI